VREKLIALYQLQEIDRRVLDIEKGAAGFPDRIKELEKGLEVLRTELGGLRTENEGKKNLQQSSDGSLKDEGAKVHKWKRRLNDIKTPREYQALSREVEQGERMVRELEDSSVALLEEIEKGQKVIDDKEAELKSKEAEVFQEVRELREKEAKLNREANEAKRGRDALVQKLPPQVVQKYDKVRERRGGIGVALLIGARCGGCNVELRPQLAVEIRKLNTIEQCPSCSRLIILEAVVLQATDKGKTPGAES
jgi:predicted  nucleic acid-binding Zn-ribbon protein